MQTPLISLKKEFLSEFLIHLNTSLSSFHDFPLRMSGILKTMGELSSHQRILVTEILRDQTFSIRYEWSDSKIQPIPVQWRHAPMIVDLSLSDQLTQQNYMIIRQEDTGSNPILHSLMNDCGCKQMLLLPLFESNLQFSFLVFMQCDEMYDWTTEELHIFMSLASVIAVQLNHYRMVAELSGHVRHLKQHLKENDDLCRRFQQLYTEIEPIWETVRNSDPEVLQKMAGLPALDQYIVSLGKLCRPVSPK